MREPGAGIPGIGPGLEVDRGCPRPLSPGRTPELPEHLGNFLQQRFVFNDFRGNSTARARRRDRRTRIAPLKSHLEQLPRRVHCFRVDQPLKGANQSRQYFARYVYRSLVSGEDEAIKVEVGLREPVLDPVEKRQATTILIDPFKNEPVLKPIFVSVMSTRETYAEKFRAALTRREPAIRDFYDIDYAVRKREVNPEHHVFVQLLRQKIDVPGNDSVEVSGAKLTVLRRQLEPQLKPVLRVTDYESFDLERAFALVSKVSQALKKQTRQAGTQEERPGSS
ncbi:MAG: nucleotidyl transferase AbiEii/AbiGii toxin family protein [Acidobacteriota bacterium]